MSDYIKIRIRRGPNPPEINQLDFYELGYSLNTKELYIKAPRMEQMETKVKSST